MTYAVFIKESAARSLSRLPKQVRQHIALKIDALAENPRPPGSAKLHVPGNLYRLRHGDYRVIYQIDDSLRRVTVATIGHRREVYRGK